MSVDQDPNLYLAAAARVYRITHSHCRAGLPGQGHDLSRERRPMGRLKGECT